MIWRMVKKMKYRKQPSPQRLLIELIVLLALFGILFVYVTSQQRIIKKLDYFDVAIKNQDYSLCNLVKTQDKQTECYIKILTSLADERKNIQYCNMIESFVKSEIGEEYAQKCRDNYYFIRAITNLEVGMCNAIKDRLLASSCREHVYNELKEITQKNDECFKIKNYEKRLSCLRLNFKNLKGKLDKNFCEKLDRELEKLACVMELKDE